MKLRNFSSTFYVFRDQNKYKPGDLGLDQLLGVLKGPEKKILESPRAPLVGVLKGPEKKMREEFLSVTNV